MQTRRGSWIGAIVLLAGCATAAEPVATHEMRVLEGTNDFLQVHEVAAWSLRSHVDHNGDRWPMGLTLGAQVVQPHVGGQERFLLLRKDAVSTDAHEDVYARARDQWQRLRQQCTTTTLVRDGQATQLPVHGISVRVLARSGLMPVPPTDSAPDPVELMVADNESDKFVVSTRLRIRLDREAWQALASAQRLEYELCGAAGTASRAELDGLREVIAKSEALRGEDAPVGVAR